MSKAAVVVSFACLAAIGTGWNSLGLKDQVDPPHAIGGLDANDTNASASLLGQFRTSTSSWLWLRTDLYLHNGVELRPLTASERQNGQKGVGSADKELGAAINDDDVVTSIPSADRDFRGWLGNLERATAPYQDMHEHTHNNPQQALPLFRLMTWIDPNFVEGWTVGSTVIAMDRTDNGTDKSLAFLKEGLADNPQSISILNAISFLYITRKRDLDSAVEYLEKARAAGLANAKSLPEDELEEFAQTYRWLALSYRDLNNPLKMDEVLKEGHQLFPDDAIINMLNDRPPLIATESGKKAWLAKHAEAARRSATQTESAAHELR